MAYVLNRPDPVDAFRNWLRCQSKLIAVAEQEGYTREQAIELLKAYALNGIEDNTRLIGGNY